jgi:hypothetical protein
VGCFLFEKKNLRRAERVFEYAHRDFIARARNTSLFSHCVRPAPRECLRSCCCSLLVFFVF